MQLATINALAMVNFNSLFPSPLCGHFLILFFLPASGHAGTCGKNGVCECFDNWGLGLSHDSGDCSDRICPYDFAWVDNPDSKGRFHKYAECSGQGLCARDTGM